MAAATSIGLTTDPETPAPAVDGLVPHLLSIAKTVRQLVGIKLAEIGVVVGQDQFLLCFEDPAPRSVAEIAAALAVRPSTISKMTDRLVGKGWVARSSNDQDARKVLLSLTEAGQQQREAVLAVEAALEAELFPLLGEQARTVVALAELDGVLTKRLSRYR